MPKSGRDRSSSVQSIEQLSSVEDDPDLYPSSQPPAKRTRLATKMADEAIKMDTRSYDEGADNELHEELFHIDDQMACDEDFIDDRSEDEMTNSDTVNEKESDEEYVPTSDASSVDSCATGLNYSTQKKMIDLRDIRDVPTLSTSTRRGPSTATTRRWWTNSCSTRANRSDTGRSRRLTTRSSI